MQGRKKEKLIPSLRICFSCLDLEKTIRLTKNHVIIFVIMAISEGFDQFFNKGKS